MTCPRCEADRDLERHTHLLAQGVEEIREGLGRELSVDERLECALIDAIFVSGLPRGGNGS